MQKQALKILILIAAIVSATVVTAAQDRVDSTSLHPGAWALQFGIGGNFTLNSFQGSTFSAKYHFSNTGALRAGITLNGITSDGTSSTTNVFDDTSNGTMTGNNSSSSQNLAFIVQYLWYAQPDGPVHIYAGIGPIVSYAYSRSSSDSYYPYAPRYWERRVSSSSATQWGAGFAGNVGLEWFAIHWLSIRAEYGESLQYQWRSSSTSLDYSYTFPGDVPNQTATSSPTKGWSLAGTGVSFGLNVYW